MRTIASVVVVSLLVPIASLVLEKLTVRPAVCQVVLKNALPPPAAASQMSHTPGRR